MKKTIEKLWNEYFLDECFAMNTDEERNLMKKTAEFHEKVSALLNKEQESAVEQYVESIYDTESLLVKKAFFKGCEFAVSFLLKIENAEKTFE